MQCPVLPGVGLPRVGSSLSWKRSLGDGDEAEEVPLKGGCSWEMELTGRRKRKCLGGDTAKEYVEDVVDTAVQPWLAFTGKGVVPYMRTFLETKVEQASFELARAVQREYDRSMQRARGGEKLRYTGDAEWDTQSGVSGGWREDASRWLDMSFAEVGDGYGQYSDFSTASWPAGSRDAAWNNASTASEGSSGGFALGNDFVSVASHEESTPVLSMEQWDAELFGAPIVGTGGAWRDSWMHAAEGADFPMM
jgi:hypothetical protein